MRVIIDNARYKDIIYIPDEIGADFELYQDRYYEWLYDKNNDHGYWIYENGKKYAVESGTDVFIDYLNRVPLKNSGDKAYLIEEHLLNVEENLPVMNV